MNNISFMLIRDVHRASRSVNEYTTEFLRLTTRNQLSESENQPEALQAKGMNFLTIVHDKSSLMSECKKI